MKLRLFLSATILEATKQMLKKIDNDDMEIEHMIVVPDRFSMQAEKLVFEMTGKVSVFNIHVMGLTALANKLVSDNISDNELITNAQSLLLTERAMLNVKENLTYFSKVNINFIHELQKAIAQVRSCNISPEELATSNLNKFRDIAIIYREYLNLLQSKLDANKLLDLLIKKIEKLNINNMNFYFCGFDAFTVEVYNLIKELVKHSKSVNISAPQCSNFANEYIYEKDILEKISNISKELGITVDVVNEKGDFTKEQEAIINNLFANQVKKCKSNYHSTFYANGKNEEIGATARIIRNLVIEGARYSDFVIACSDIERYSHLIEKIFDEFEIPYFIDKSITCDKTILANLIFKFFDVIISGYSKESLLGLVSSVLIEITEKEKIISLIEKYNIDKKWKFDKYISEELFEIKNILEKIENGKSVVCFCEVVVKILEISNLGLEKLLNFAENKGQLKEKNINMQAKEIIIETCNTILNFENNITIKEFVKKVKLLLSFKEVMSVPTFIDAVFIGDATKSYFGECENLFVLGCESLPSCMGDNGLISDDNIMTLNLSKKLEPSIRMINRRNRFKLFNLLTCGKKRLITTYLTINEEGKKTERPLFIENLNNIFESKEISASRFLDLATDNKKIFMSAFGTRENALNGLARFYKNGYIPNNLIASLDDVLKPDYKSFTIERSVFKGDCYQTYFPNGNTKVTQIENYFSCPFKHFVKYGLKLKEKQNSNIDGRDIGNVCHKMAEIFVREFKNTIKSVTDKQIEKFIENNIEEVLQQVKVDEKLATAKDKNVFLNYLTTYVFTLLKKIRYELKSSSFEVYDVEYKINNLYFKLENKQIPLIGKVDRIDICGDYFRIIDYKTGDVGSVLKDLYYGDKIQLFIYQKAISEKLNKKSAGAFYFDSKWDFKSTEQPILKGIIADDEESIDMFDKDISFKGKSDIIGISLSSSKNKKYNGTSISKNPLSKFERYALEVSKKALEEIVRGNIAPKPDDKACENCEYLGICLYSQQKGYRKKYKIKEEELCDVGGDSDA